MMPGECPLDLYRGDTRRYQFKLWADAAKTVPADLTGVTAAAMIRDKATGGTFAVELACTITQPNIIDIPITTDATFPAKGVWDLQLTYPNSDIVTVLKGPVTVTADVTYSAVGSSKLKAVP